MENYQFGYGCMRLPLLNAEDPASFDYPLIEKLFDTYLEQGFTYFDAAYTYHGYHCEEAVRETLVRRHPRDSFELATKLPLRDFKDAEDMERIFNEQLEHCGVEYFDYYLLHNMGTNVYEKCQKYDAFGFAARKKQGRYAGQSAGGSPEADERIPSGCVGDIVGIPLCGESGRRRESPVGNEFHGAGAGQHSDIQKFQTYSYCTHGCPKQIAIPQYFALYNSISRTTGSFSSHAVYYNNISLRHGKASDCIGCKQCEKACPQHLPITEYLKDVAAKFEAGGSFPTRK